MSQFPERPARRTASLYRLAILPFRTVSALRMPGILAILLALGLATRVRIYLGNPSYWYDEAFVLMNVFDKSFLQLLGRLDMDQAAPPLFLWMLRGLYLAAGSGEWAMRLPSFVAGLPAPLIMIPVARLVSGRGWGWAVAYLAVSIHGLTHGCEVKPYAIDLAVGLLVTWVAARMITGSQDEAGTFSRWLTLLSLAAVGPWLSFPSVFVLGGASVALAVSGLRWRGWVAWLGYNGALAGSFVLCTKIASPMRSSALQQYWEPYFLNLGSLDAAVSSISQCLVDIGDYGTTGMGIPLLGLAIIGLTSLWRERCGLALLLFAPVFLGGIASAMHRYPLNDRLLFFLVPCIWLPAARGVGCVLAWLPRRFLPLGITAFSVLILPGTVRTIRYIPHVDPKVEFREAYGYVRLHEEKGDTLWTSCPQVYRLYAPDALAQVDLDTLVERLEQATPPSRLWLVYFPDQSEIRDTLRRLDSLHFDLQEDRQFVGLEVRLYVPVPFSRSSLISKSTP
jgi:hypothetical protein